MIEEKKHLIDTLDKYDEVIDDSNLKIKNLKKFFANDYDAMMDEKERLENKIKSVEKAKLNPYFGRIDFENGHTDICYIGKLGVSDYDNNIITVDWRAPIATLYYDSNIGPCSYNVEKKKITGNLKLKRQYVIENSNLISFNDVDTVSNDDLLKPYLSSSADNRLKNIVSTIQAEQNKIIRERLGKNMIIQGVAGSGKTTVALHRIAYLVYNNRKLFKPSDYMVIGPNKFFVSYISSILPDLDVHGVTELTIDELMLSFVNEKFYINNSLDTIKLHDEVSKFKTSMNLKKEIDKYFKNLQILPNEDFCIESKIILSAKLIKNFYNEIDKNIFKNVFSKINKLILLLNKYISDNKDRITDGLIKNNTKKKTIDEFKNNVNSHLNKYFGVLNKKVKDIYMDVLKLSEIDLKNIKNNRITVDDIPGLMYIKYKLSGSNMFDNYKHIVIDEAQDYGEFLFYVLNKIFKNTSFSIYGDIAQSLYPYRSINNWDEIKSIFKDVDIIKLNKSYRTTIEIMNEANKINELLKLDKAVPVIRHGDDVLYSSDDVVDIINNMKKNYKTIAIITHTQDDANLLFDKISNEIDCVLINSKNLSYDNNIIVLPSYLSKGLEFDCVILIDKKSYDKNNMLDMKLLYVSMTRALHKLIIL